MENGLVRHGIAVCNVLLERDPTIGDAWILKASLLAGIGDHQSVVKMLETAIERGARGQVRNTLGIALADLGRHAEAIDSYAACLRDEPDSAETILARGNQANSYTALGKFSEAEGAYREAVGKGAPPVIVANFVRMLITTKRWPEVREWAAKGLATADSDALRAQLHEDIATAMRKRTAAQKA
jgi:tetratricopeptide (TPR) repeat protein